MNLVRRVVYWIGSEPDSGTITEFANRDLRLEVVDNFDQIPFSAQWTRWLVCDGRNGRFRYVKRLIDRHLAIALTHGVGTTTLVDDQDPGRVEVLLRAYWSDEELLKSMNEALNVRDQFAVTDVEAVRRVPDTPWLEDDRPEIISSVSGLNLPPETQVFLKRAFRSYRTLDVEPLSGGKVAEVYLVRAVHQDDTAGSRKIPFLAKCDKKTRINQERDNYEQHALPYIPFNLRPNLHSDKCLDGYDMSFLVGDFVDGAVPLSDVVKPNASIPIIPIIHSLFDSTLLGWRLAREPHSDEGLEEGLLDFLNRRPISASVVKNARDLSAEFCPDVCVLDVDALARSIVSTNRVGHRFMRGIVHGDLHLRNVMVRAGDAVLIDFASANYGPLIEDIARLEVSIASEISGECLSNKEWIGRLMEAYETRYLTRRVFGERPQDKFSNSMAAVRHLRMRGLADECEVGQYAEMLAIQWLRQSSFGGEGSSLAYLLANKCHCSLEGIPVGQR